MAITVTDVVKPIVLGPNCKMAIYNVAWDTSYPTGGEPITSDITDDFTYIYGIEFAGQDTLADWGYTFGAVLPSPSTAVTTANTLLTVFWDPADASCAEPLDEFTNTGSLSAIGQTTIIVYGN
jgi:hypothetical protein